jgi:sortase A
MKRILTIGLVLIGVASIAQGLWIPAKAQLAQVLLRRAWQRTLAGDAAAKPWPWADTHPVARLVIDRTGSDFVVLAGSDGRALAFAPGHLDHTPLPGERGNCVITGHRDTHFTALRDLRDGDTVRVQRADGRWHAYTVSGHRIVDKRDVWVTRGSGADALTLVTCYPFDAVVPGGSGRYVVQLTR